MTVRGYKVGDRVRWTDADDGGPSVRDPGRNASRGTVVYLDAGTERVAVRWDDQMPCRPHDWLYPADLQPLDPMSRLGELAEEA